MSSRTIIRSEYEAHCKSPPKRVNKNHGLLNQCQLSRMPMLDITKVKRDIDIMLWSMMIKSTGGPEEIRRKCSHGLLEICCIVAEQFPSWPKCGPSIKPLKGASLSDCENLAF